MLCIIIPVVIIRENGIICMYTSIAELLLTLLLYHMKKKKKQNPVILLAFLGLAKPYFNVLFDTILKCYCSDYSV